MRRHVPSQGHPFNTNQKTGAARLTVLSMKIHRERRGLPRRLVLPESRDCGTKAEVQTKALNPGFLKKIHFFENFVPQISEN
jgi:hypothetical protein